MSYAPNALRVFLMAHNGERQSFLNFLDTRPEVLNWMANLSHGVLIISKQDASTLTNIIHKAFPYEWFVISEIDPSKVNGFIDKRAWDFVNNPRASGRWG